MSINLKCEDGMGRLMTTFKRLSTYILFDFKVSKWAVSTLTHFSNPFQVNMFMYRQQLRYLLLLMYSLLYMLSTQLDLHCINTYPYTYVFNREGGKGGGEPVRRLERQVKVLIKNLAIFLLFPGKEFLPR